jgi:hypothetical protein
MIRIMDKVLTAGMLLMALITIWSVVTDNHLFIS